MPNHVHLIAAPESEDGLRRVIGEDKKPRGQAAGLKILKHGNPVKVGLVKRPEQYRWAVKIL